MENEYNLNIERSVISSIIFDPEMYESITINEKDFYLPAHQNIVKAIDALYKAEKPIDEEFLKAELTKEGIFDETVILDVLSANPISNLDAYISQLRDFRAKREIRDLTFTIQKQLEEGIDARVIKSDLLQRLETTTKPYKPVLTPISLGSVEATETDFMLKGFLPLPKGAVSFIVASGGTGKSFVSLQAGLRYVAQNEDKRAFLWLSEDDKGLTRKRASDICTSFGIDRSAVDQLDIADDMPSHFTEVESFSHKVTTAFYEVKKILKSYDLIVLDPLIAFFGGDENNNSQARYFMQLLTKWAKEENKAILIVHHVKKVKEGEEGVSRGAGAFVDAVRLVYTVSKEKDEPTSRNLCFKITKDNYNAKTITGEDFKRVIFPFELTISDNNVNGKGGENETRYSKLK